MTQIDFLLDKDYDRMANDLTGREDQDEDLDFWTQQDDQLRADEMDDADLYSLDLDLELEFEDDDDGRYLDPDIYPDELAYASKVISAPVRQR